MKKAMKKLMAALMAVAMLCALAVPAFAEKGKPTANISNHSFSAYQIFTATVSDVTGESGKVSDVDWGTSVNSSAILAELASDATFGSAFNTSMTATQVVEAMSGWSATEAKTTAFAKIVARHTKTAYTTSTTSTITFDAAGYYLIVDTTNTTGQDDAKNLSLLNVVEAGSVTVTSKVVKPTVDKFVQDNDDGAYAGNGGENDGFGKTADHAIGESFKFELVANLPANDHYNDYNEYKVVFHDTMSKGITFESIDRVVIAQGGTETPISDYTFTGIKANQNGPVSDWTVTIANAKAYGVDLTNGATIKVYYNAHLNGEAYVNTASGETTNKNSVYLEYSNNPNADGTGKTPDETVYVFTYEIDNTKYHDSVADGNELANAGFRLYKDAGCTEEVTLAKDTSGDYMPTTDTGVEMKSGADGKFNIKGLDAGIYYLKETTTPDGYNTCANVEIKIIASHKPDANEIGKVDLTGSENMANNVVNKSGTVLPSTGGIGTTIFYVVGGGLMIAAAVLLITKKRMEGKN